MYPVYMRARLVFSCLFSCIFAYFSSRKGSLLGIVNHVMEIQDLSAVNAEEQPSASSSAKSAVSLPPGVVVSAVSASSSAPEAEDSAADADADGDSHMSAAGVLPAGSVSGAPDVDALVAPIASALANVVANVANAASAANTNTNTVSTGSANSVNGAEGGAVSAQPSAADKAQTLEHHNKRSLSKYAHSWQVPVALACILLGIMVGLQYRSQAGKGDLQIDDRRKLVELVRTMESERNKMSNELKETRAHMVELEESAGKREQVSKQLQDQLVRSRIEAGLTGMKGPGVVVSMNDSPRTAPASEDNYFYIVHDVDLTALVNELWAAGAEAICVNEQRIVTRSSIRCVGPAVLVNGVRLTAPYVVKAIGSKDLETALRMPGGFLNSMAPLISKGGEVKMNSMQEVVIPPYEGSNSFRYGQSFEKTAENTATDEKDSK